jgi:fermentation-respiration switch protein FrsA (DUF1100 family)
MTRGATTRYTAPRCPFLVLHGEDDEQIPLADARALYEACGSQDKTLRVFSAEENGAQPLPARLSYAGLRQHVDWFDR